MESISNALIGGYMWYKALHVISIIAWMAGLLYLPRLFVYHCGVDKDSEASATFKIMERRLYKAIMMPAMIASWLFALLMLAAMPDWLSQPWMHAKLLFVVGLTVMHFIMAAWLKAFAQDRNTHGATYYRAMNEVPTLLMIFIVILVILKPF